MGPVNQFNGSEIVCNGSATCRQSNQSKLSKANPLQFARQISATRVLLAAAAFLAFFPAARVAAQVVLPYPGNISTLAGQGEKAGYSGDGGLALKANLYYPWAAVVDASGNIYIADSNNHRIRKITASTGNISTVAGNGTAGFSGDGGPATSAELNSPEGVARDSAGNIYISDFQNNRVRMVCASTTSPIHGVACPAAGDIVTIAGNTSTCSYSGNGGASTSAGVCTPRGIALDASGNLYFAEFNNYVVRKVTASTGIISLYAGNHTQGGSGNGGPAVNAQLSGPNGIAIDSAGNLYIADNDVYSYDNTVRKVTASTGVISVAAGIPGTYPNSSCQGGAATSVALNSPEGVAVDASGNLYIADYGNSCILEVTASTGNMAKLAGPGPQGGGYSGDGGPATNAGLESPADVALDSSGNLYIADAFNDVIRAVAPVKTAVVVATMTLGSAGNSSAGTAPQRKNLAQCYTGCSGGKPTGGTSTAYCTTAIQSAAEAAGCSAYGPVPTLSVTNPSGPNGSIIEDGNGAGGSDTPSAMTASYGTNADDVFCTSDPYRSLASGYAGLTLPGCVANSTSTFSQTTSGTSTDTLFPATWVVSGSSHNADTADHYVRESWWSIPCSTYNYIMHVEYDTNYSASNGQYYGWGIHWSKDAKLANGTTGQMFQYDPQGYPTWRTLQFNPVNGGSPVTTFPVACGQVIHTRIFMHRGSITACTNTSANNCYFYDQMYVQNCGGSASTCASSPAGTLYNLVDAVTGAIPGGIPLDKNWTAYEPDLQVQIDTQTAGTASVSFDSDTLVIFHF
ncbi:hypothetical protein DYQ86_12880 [Acidobacteria bacterium AB60]|nr:hypothetical protein DYQ86_12880 [Acidobacteria bacterium AB60]